MTISFFQKRVDGWMIECFGKEASLDATERNARFLEEALEVVRACDMPKADAIALIDYVYSRPVGDRLDEIGDALLGLSALASAWQIGMYEASEAVLRKVFDNIDAIREKQKNKPRGSPLPTASAT